MRVWVGTGSPHQQGADQAGTGGIGDRVDIRRRAAGLVEHLADQRQHALDVVARGQLGHDAAVDAMEVDLTEQRVGQQAAFAVVKGDAGFVAGRFQSQHAHGLEP